MMKVIMHNSASLDMSITGIPVSMERHYKIVSMYEPDVYMFGSETAYSWIKEDTPKERKVDLKKPKKKKPYWAIVDSKGKMENWLHFYRQSDYSGNIIVLVSEETPQSYLDYLEEREYDYIQTGKKYVDYKEALKVLAQKYEAKTLLLDSGGKLNSYFFEHSLIDEISVLVTPIVKGTESLGLFRDVLKPVNLKLLRTEVLDDYVWLVFQVIK
jgi:2,5-diamino-6-(ribosylamino)-4(3H)-pyrimidinone 5'-phosphate reductase